MTAEICRNCKFALVTRVVRCRRYPPIMYPHKSASYLRITYDAQFPVMRHNDWCGEFASTQKEGE